MTSTWRARAEAEEAGLTLVRTGSFNVMPEFIRVLADVVDRENDFCPRNRKTRHSEPCLGGAALQLDCAALQRPGDGVRATALRPACEKMLAI